MQSLVIWTHNTFHLCLGTDAMSSKATIRMLINDNKQRPRDASNVVDVRRTFSTRSPSSNLKCPMQIIIFLGQDDRFYLSTKSCLTHLHHPPLKAEAILRGHIDMDQGDLDLLSLLFSVNATGVQISQIMHSLKGPEAGTYLPKRIYDMNQKTEHLHDLALGLIPGCSDAKKTITKLEEAGINHFYVVHENGGLYACSKGRPTKALAKMRLECPDQIEEEIVGLRKDFLMNDNCKMLLLVSMATDEMIRLVSMYPEVWFMDTTAGTNRHRKELFVMAVRTPAGQTFPGNFAIIPSAKKWVFHAIFRLAFLELYGDTVCSMNRLVLTDEEDAEYRSFESLIATNDKFKNSKVMLCIFHAIWQPFKRDIYPLCPRKSTKGKPLELSTVGSDWATYLYTVFQYQACVYRTQDQYDKSHVLLTEMLQTDVARSILSQECISAIEKFQVVMKEKQQYIAHYVRLGVSLIRHAATTSPVESMNGNIKGTMGCSSNINTSTSLLKMAKGSNRRITMFDNDAQRALQETSLSSKLIVKDTILKQCLHICNQNFDQRKYYKCVQCSEDDWMVWNFYNDTCKINENIAEMVPKFLNVFHVRLKRFLGVPYLRCDCRFYDTCGLPCQHILRITNEVRHEMIHVQNWKIYASHYNDGSTELGFELRKAQLHFKQYGENMGVPVTDDIVFLAKRSSVDDNFPFLFDGTSVHDYNEAHYIEQNNNCITIREWNQMKGTLKAATDIMTTSKENTMDDLFEMGTNNSDEMTWDILNDDMCGNLNDGNNTPMKKKDLFEYETPLKSSNELHIFNNTQTFLSPTTKELQNSMEKAASSVMVVYNTDTLKSTRKNIIESVDHILGNDLVQENPQIAAFVTELERKVQEIKEEFTKSVHAVTGTIQGNACELTFPAFQSRKRKDVNKRYKGLSG